MPESMSHLAQRPWLRVESSLSELDALLGLVETRSAVSEGELRGHLLELYRRVDGLRASIDAAGQQERDPAKRSTTLQRLAQLEARAGGQEDRLLALAMDVNSLRQRQERLEADMVELKLEMKTLRQGFEALRVELRTAVARNHEQVMSLLMKLV